MGGEYVLPRRQGLEAALLAAIPQRARHDRKEGGPQRAAPLADFTAAHRVAARTRQARARAVEGGGGEEAATTAAACPLYCAALLCQGGHQRPPVAQVQEPRRRGPPVQEQGGRRQ